MTVVGGMAASPGRPRVRATPGVATIMGTSGPVGKRGKLLSARRGKSGNAMDPVQIKPTDVSEGPVDDRGRVSVGTEYAGETVRVAVLETVSAEDSDGTVWFCQFCDSAYRADSRPETCPECGVEGDGLQKLDVQTLS